ncbi:MAG: CRTAC1 family protein [Candidatus Poribacteria bacterium]|nr:CRTAC1 family protein [Candidatus Poribacteria bacterium]
MSADRRPATTRNAALLTLAALAWASAASEMRFVDIAEEAGIHFRHTDGRTGERRFIETIGSGAALFDYNNDGRLDIYLVNAGGAPNRLYRNEGARFIDATDETGTGHTGYGVGVCAADVNGDGWQDLFIANCGENVLYMNRNGTHFENVTEESGVADNRWSAAAAFGDVDKDGDLDLYVAYYCVWDPDNQPRCAQQGVPIYCGPEEMTGEPDKLFLNDGTGRFEDATERAGLSGARGKGLAAVFSDLDGDGDLDLYVANDAMPNFLYINDGSGTFEETAWMAGTDGDSGGNPQGSMGIAVGDMNRDGRFDLFVTNYQRQYNALYRNDGSGFFSDISYAAGMGGSLPLVSWGTAFVDFDQDGWLDLFAANGHIQDRIEAYDPSSTYAQRNSLYRNEGGARFVEAAGLPPAADVSRGAAFGDIDNDGDIDILVNNANGPPQLLRNDTDGGNWLTVILEGRSVGAAAKAQAGGAALLREARAGGSYGSSGDMRLHFGLGTAEKAELVEVRWLYGGVSRAENVKANQFLLMREPTR